MVCHLYLNWFILLMKQPINNFEIINSIQITFLQWQRPRSWSGEFPYTYKDNNIYCLITFAPKFMVTKIIFIKLSYNLLTKSGQIVSRTCYDNCSYAKPIDGQFTFRLRKCNSDILNFLLLKPNISHVLIGCQKQGIDFKTMWTFNYML